MSIRERDISSLSECFPLGFLERLRRPGFRKIRWLVGYAQLVGFDMTTARKTSEWLSATVVASLCVFVMPASVQAQPPGAVSVMMLAPAVGVAFLWALCLYLLGLRLPDLRGIFTGGLVLNAIAVALALVFAVGMAMMEISGPKEPIVPASGPPPELVVIYPMGLAVSAICIGGAWYLALRVLLEKRKD